MCPNDPIDRIDASTSRRRVLTGAASIGAASLATGTAAAAEHDHENEDEGTESEGEEGTESEGEEDGEMSTEENTPFSSVEFTNQSSEGSEIVVDMAVLSDGGYVAIHDASLLQGKIAESVIGVSDYLEAGVHYAVPVTLFDVPGAEFDVDTLTQSQPLIAMPHRETGDNETYDFVTSGGEEDGPYVESELPVIDAGLVVVGADESDAAESPFATIGFENQSVAEGTAVVRDVTLSEGGFIALHDARLLQGDPFESVVGVSEYLEAGQHQAVEIEIEEPSAIAELELPARLLLPMPHLDTNGNEEYDFVTSEGSEDGAYTDSGQAVIDAGLVMVE